MTRTEIEEKVRDFLIEDLEIEEENIFPDARLKEDMGIDSLDYVDIVVIVEKNFGFKIVPQEMASVKTLSQFYCQDAFPVLRLYPVKGRIKRLSCNSRMFPSPS